jgi:uncharacterized membrane protein SpoIIM required for sporulation
MFDERQFILAKERQWTDLTEILRQVQISGLKGLPHENLLKLGSLYRHVCSDLAYARSQRATAALIAYLNQLTGDTHSLLYTENKSKHSLLSIVRFFTTEYPSLIRRRAVFIWTAIALSVIGYMVGYFIVVNNPSKLSLFVPAEFSSSADAWKKGFADHGDISIGKGALFSSFLMTHNTQVGIVVFATGVLIAPPIYMLISNGWLMGALVAVVAPTGHLGSLWAGILMHGVFELTALFICGAAGLLLGWSFIAPGQLRRKDALVANAKDAVALAIGTVPLFIIAGLIEGNISHSSLPHAFKFGLALFEFVALMLYFLSNRKSNTE